MAREYVTYKCGHEGEEFISGNRRQRERRVDWIEKNKNCPDCWKKQQDESGPSATIEGGRDANGVTIANTTFHVSNSYPVRQILESRGYEFDGESKCWVKQVADETAAIDEYKWIQSQEWEIHGFLTAEILEKLNAAV